MTLREFQKIPPAERQKRRILCPRISGQGRKRMVVTLGKADYSVMASPGWANYLPRTFTDVKTKKKYRFVQATCHIPGCRCDVVAKEVK